MSSLYNFFCGIACVVLLCVQADASTEDYASWVVVLDDPRAERHRGWLRSDNYRGSLNYDHNLVLQRLADSVLKGTDAQLQDQWPIGSIRVHCLIIKIPQANESQTLSRLEQDDRVKWLQPLQTFSAQSLSPSEVSIVDPYLQLQSSFKQLQVDGLQNRWQGKGITLAVIDSAIEVSHPDLAHAVIEQKNFVSVAQGEVHGEYHGTGVAGVMVAASGNGLGISGLVPRAKLRAYRGCWELSNGTTRCDTLSLARALERVVETRPDILNLSLTGPRDRLLEQILSVVVNNGTKVVAAYDTERVSDQRFPPPTQNVFIARNLNQSDVGLGDGTLAAPGQEIITTQPGNTYSFMSGSSIATAHMTSLLAMVYESVPDASDDSVRRAFTRHTHHNHVDFPAVLMELGVDFQ